MLNEEIVAAWLDKYVRAWKSYDSAQIGELFSEDAVYAYTPFDEPLRGRAAIIASWLADQDAPNSYDAQYYPVMIQGDRAVTNGRSRYLNPDRTLEREFDNIFILRFDAENRVNEFREWYFERPD